MQSQNNLIVTPLQEEYDQLFNSLFALGLEFEKIRSISSWPLLTNCFSADLFNIGRALGFTAASLKFKALDVVDSIKFKKLVELLKQNNILRAYIDERLVAYEIKGL